ncbi:MULTISPECIES: acyl carrier protein [unclassified Streptomyces]|uniref:acyl carrier protein n=1 Tax=unclassified Streptomyces TaxID=2593676 RepID=UPI002E1CFE63|nr:acyl carrier protein [Streptomyces sp. NBC_01023]
MPEPASSQLTVITDWLLRRKPELAEIPRDFDLIENRVLDSLALTEFLFLVEQETGRQYDPESLAVDDFRTLDNIEKRFLEPR